MNATRLCLICNASVSIAMVIGIVILYPNAGLHAFWLLLAMFGHDSVSTVVNKEKP